MTFVKGKSGNPGGRPKGLAKLVRDIVGPQGMAEVIRAQYQIALGKHPLAGELGEEAPTVQARESTGAATWLRDTGYGKPQQSLDLTTGGEKIGGGQVVVDVSGMSEAELASIEAAAAAALAEEEANDGEEGEGEEPDGGAEPDDEPIH